MSDDSQTPETGDNNPDMNATVASFSKSMQLSEPPEIPEGHRRYAAAILAMDPIEDVRGNVSIDTINPNFSPKITTLSPDMQAEAHALMQKEGMEEGEAVAKVAKKHLGKMRADIGSSPNTNAYHRELISIASEVRDIERKRAGYQEMVDRVVGVTYGGLEDGEPVANPVYGYTETSREKFQGEIAKLDYAKSLLVKPDGSLGYEGKKRADRALVNAAAKMAEAVDKLRLRKEAEEQADEMLRNEERERLAKQIADTRRRQL